MAVARALVKLAQEMGKASTPPGEPR